MQTFLPYADFARSARVLDRKRLGKQRIETKQILLTITEHRDSWASHPAVRMWRGFDHALASYGAHICLEWRKRNYADSLLPFFEEHMEKYHQAILLPKWFGDGAFHLSHQSNLLRKDAAHYRPFFGEHVPTDLPYYWPV